MPKRGPKFRSLYPLRQTHIETYFQPLLRTAPKNPQCGAIRRALSPVESEGNRFGPTREDFAPSVGSGTSCEFSLANLLGPNAEPDRP